jgi:hypothetical protein
MEFLDYFGKNKEGMIIVYDVYTFNSLFSLLLNESYAHQNAMDFIIANCDLNAYVFQECIHNNAYLKLESQLIDFTDAGRKSALHAIALSFIER